MSWLIARDAAAADGTSGHAEPRRSRSARACSWPSSARCCSRAPFPIRRCRSSVLGLAVAILTPRALQPDRRWSRVGLGVCLGLAWLSRSEAIWLAVAVLIVVLRAVPAGQRVRVLTPVAIAGALTVTPWLIRNTLTFGSPLAGQAIQNALLTRNEQIFAWTDPPTLSGFSARASAGSLGNELAAVVHQLVSVLLMPAFPLGIVGLAALLVMRRSPAFRAGTSLNALLLGGLLTFVATAVVFPVATLWGTFLHASGPLLVGLTVCAVSA